MIYTKMTKIAMKLAYDAHNGQVDKAGLPYIFHPIIIAENMRDENTTITALLHDVIEDTNITLEELEQLGFNAKVIEAIKLVTRSREVSYDDYIKNIGENEIATIVKLQDLSHNLVLQRFEHVDEKIMKRTEKYKKAQLFLKHKLEEKYEWG